MTLDQALTEARRRPGSDELAVWVREAFDRQEPDFAEAWPSEDLGNVVLVLDGLLKKITPDQADDLAVALLSASSRAREEFNHG